MKNLYMLAKLFLAAALTANIITSSAQHTIEYLNANNLNAGFGIGGSLFTMFPDTTFHQFPDTSAKFALLEVPKGSGIKTMFTDGLWMSGFDASFGVPHCGMQGHNINGSDFYDGPIVSNYDTVYDNFYKRVFKVTRNQIVRHQSLGNPIIPTLIDTAILFWPAKGNAYVAGNFGVTISNHLAPFVDVNNNGVYDPNHGDYPAICGDEAVFFVFNDERSEHPISNTQNKLGFEIRGMAEVFRDTLSSAAFEKRALNNTVLVDYEIENKSQESYYDFYLGMFSDPDLGCWSNDRVGCDTNRNIMFVYNGSTPDPDCNGVIGYGQLSASQNVAFLNSNMTSFAYYTNGADWVNQEPGSCMQYRNYLQGYWLDGTPYTLGGTGYGGITPTKFIFPGDPNNPNDWSEVSVSGQLPPGDRRMLGSTGPVNFASGEIKHYDFAFTASYDSTATIFTIVDTLKRDADLIQNFYNNTLTNCRNQQIALGFGNGELKDELQISVHPNPASSLLFIESETDINSVELTDILGRTVLAKTADSKKLLLDISAISRGMYLVRVKAGSKTAVKKIVIGQ